MQRYFAIYTLYAGELFLHCMYIAMIYGTHTPFCALILIFQRNIALQGAAA